MTRVLDKCPECGYSLEGLPAEHRCPECGLFYDELSVPHKRVNRGAMGQAIGFGVGSVWILSQLMGPVGMASAQLLYLFMIFYFVVLGWFLYRLVKQHRRGALVVPLPQVLFIRLDNPFDERIAWERIARVSPNRATKGVTLFMKRSRTTRDVAGVFKTDEDRDRFIEIATKRIVEAALREDEAARAAEG